MSKHKTPREMQNEMLNSLTKWEEKTDDTLAKLFRRIMSVTGVSPSVWNNHVERYLNHLKKHRKMSSHDAGTIRGNLNKALLAKPNMTISSLRRGLQFLGYPDVEIIIRVKKNGRVIEVSDKIEFK